MNDQSVRGLQDALEAKYKGLILMLSYMTGGDEYSPPVVRINTISIPKDERKQGLGSEIMSQIISWADTHGVMLTLSPSTDFGATSVARLTRFYRRFGFVPNKGRNKDFRTRETMLRNPKRVRTSAKRDDPKLKNTGHGGLDTWFAGHGGGKPDERATWGDWIAITPIKHTIKKDDGEEKVYEAGDIVGPCAVSSEAEWASITDGGKNPLKCMPRDKAHDLTKEQRATLARKKRREESKAKDGQKPVLTPTFSEKGKEMINKKAGLEEHFDVDITTDDLYTKLPLENGLFRSTSTFQRAFFSDVLSHLPDTIEREIEALVSGSSATLGVWFPSMYAFRKAMAEAKSYKLGEMRGGLLEADVNMTSREPHITLKGRLFYTLEVHSLRNFLRNPVVLYHNLSDVKITLENSYAFNEFYESWLMGNLKKASVKRADFYREVTPPDQLSSLTQGTPIGRSDNPDGVNPHSALPNGDSARNIGRPSPDSPNLKYRNLDRSDAYGRTPAEGQDFGYVHDSGSGSARVIPYDSGFANNGSALRRSASRVALRYMRKKEGC